MGDGQTSRRWKTTIRPNTRKQHQQTNQPCWLCGQPIDYTITDQTNDGVWEPDHIYPRSTHPHLAEDPTNLKPSHRACNRERSNKQHINGLGTLTRNWLGT